MDVRPHQFLLVACAAAYAAVAVWTLADPEGALASVGVGAASGSARIEIRAMYGGMELGLALFLLRCARGTDWLRPGLAAAAASIGGLGVVRAVSLVMAFAGVVPAADTGAWLLVGFATLELLGSAACAWAYVNLP